MNKINKKDETFEISFLSRLLAYCIDFALIVLISAIVTIPVAFITVPLGIEPENPLIIQTAIILVSFIYFVGLEGYISTTLGRKMCDIGTVTEGDGKELDFITSFKRNIGKIHPYAILIDFVMGLAYDFNQKRRLFEIYSKTVSKKIDYISKNTKQEQKTLRVFRIVLGTMGLIGLVVFPLGLILSPILNRL